MRLMEFFTKSYGLVSCFRQEHLNDAEQAVKRLVFNCIHRCGCVFSHREMFDVHVAAAGEGKAKLYHSNSSILQELEQTASKQNVCYSGGWWHFCALGFLFALSSMLVASDNR